MSFGVLKRLKPQNFRLLLCIIGLFCGLLYFNTDAYQRALWQYHIKQFVTSFIENPLYYKNMILMILCGLVVFCTIKILDTIIKTKKTV